MKRILPQTQTTSECVSCEETSLKLSNTLETSLSGNPHIAENELGTHLSPDIKASSEKMIAEDSVGRQLFNSSRHRSSLRKAYRPIR